MTGFKKATRQHIYLKLALTGPSGSGKTYSALQLAFGLGSRIALIDTENASASLYCELGDYDTLELTPPFTVRKYVDAVNQAVKAGYDVLIIDSLSHAWAGEGGLLAQKESLDARGGNSYTNWASITKQHEALKAAILQAPIHSIVTMRSKQDYILVEKNGKQVPQKVGLAPIQRDGMEYEYTVVLDIAMNHESQASKDRTGLFEGSLARLTPEHGVMLKDWLAGHSPSADVQVIESVGHSAVQVDVVNIVDRKVAGQMYSFIVGKDKVIQVPVLSDVQRQQIQDAGTCKVSNLVDTKRTVKVGSVQLPVFEAQQVDTAELAEVNTKQEVSTNGQG